MRHNHSIHVIIPALNEECSLPKVIHDIPVWVDEIIVVDNGSTDNTAQVARDAGARLVTQREQGYGCACMAGIASIYPTQTKDIVVILDGDYSDDPQQMDELVDPLIHDDADLVIGSRTLGGAVPGALTLPARFGNWLCCRIIRMVWRQRFTDLGPFRAIYLEKLKMLGLQDRNFGWNIEMHVKALLYPLRIQEISAKYRKRIGQSKISGTVRGVFAAGVKILWVLFREVLCFVLKKHPANPFKNVSQERDRLLMFTRYPEAGKTKTRLIPLLGGQGAADLQRRLTEKSVAQMKPLFKNFDALEIRYTGTTEEKMQRWLGLHHFVPQGEGDLGKRMASAFDKAFEQGKQRVVVMGIDCPGLRQAHVAAALEALDAHDIVLGPAEDGGYYLLGLNRRQPQIFESVDWGTESVLQSTLAKAKSLDLKVKLLGSLRDLDLPEDYEDLAESYFIDSRSLISVVIPTLNEEKNIQRQIQLVQQADHVECLVVDGGSQDQTESIAQSCGVKVLTGVRGRGRQLNLGAKHAKGEVILFLHADTELPEGYDRIIRQSLTDDVGLGAFRLGIDAAGSGYRRIERSVNNRFWRRNFPYGDQALFIRRATFNCLGGFADIDIMEDFDLVRRVRKNHKIVIAPLAVKTSPRRWQRLGLLRTTLMNQCMIFGYFLGVPTKKLAHWYQNAR